MLNLIAIKLTQDQIINLSPGGEFSNVSNLSIGSIIAFGISFILIVASLIFFFMLLFGGIKWILSGGDKAKTEGARNQITAALIGLVIVFSAWAIVTLLGTIFGIGDITNFEIGSISDIQP